MKNKWLNKVFNYLAIKIKSSYLWYEDFIDNLLKNKNTTDVMGEKQQQKSQQMQGFPCPECGTVTPITMEMLIYNQPIYCAGCGIKFTISTSESHDVIEDLKKVHKAQQEVKNMKGVKTK